MVFTFKFKIESPYINHNFELFSVRYDDFFSIVSRFHLPCVRGFYNGTNVYLTPSCISAHMTYMNIDYKYICGTKDPVDIINKNRVRGFGTWLNETEKKQFVKYSSEIPFWNNLYTINSTTPELEANKQIFGPLSLNHTLFRPRLYNADDYNDAMYVDTTERYRAGGLPQTVCDYVKQNNKSVIQERFNSIEINKIDYDSLISIDSNGYIVPFKSYVINLTWDLANRFKKELNPVNPVNPVNSVNSDSKIKKNLKKNVKKEYID